MLLLWLSTVFFSLASCFAAVAPTQASLLPESLAALVPAEIFPHIYCHNGSFFYLPSSQDRTKVFDKINPSIISKIMSIEDGNFKNMFQIALLNDYIMAYFVTDRMPSAKDLKSLNALPHITEVLERPVDQILWALYFATGSVHTGGTKEMRSFVKTFSQLGFDWKKLRSGSGYLNRFMEQRSTRLRNMLPIYLIAHCFRIDILKIAESAKNRCEISREISLGLIPEMLKSVDTIDCQQVFFAVYETYPVALSEKNLNTQQNDLVGIMPEQMYFSDELPRQETYRRTSNRLRKIDAQPTETIIYSSPVPYAPYVAVDDGIVDMTYFPEELGKIQEEINAQQPAPNVWGNNGIDSIIPESIRSHIFLNAEQQYFYLPPQDGIKLFDRIGRKSVIEIMKASEDLHPHLFSISLFKDYILPVIHADKMDAVYLSDLPYIYDCLRPLFKRLLWAIYFSEGDTPKPQTSTHEYYEFLFNRFGLKWGRLRTGCGNTLAFEKQRINEIPGLLGIYYVAQWWGVDVDEIARRTAVESTLSQSIFVGVWPEKLANATFPTSTEIFYSVEGVIPIKKISNEAVGAKRSPPWIIIADGPAKRRRIEKSVQPAAPIVIDISDENDAQAEKMAETSNAFDLCHKAFAQPPPPTIPSVPPINFPQQGALPNYLPQSQRSPNYFPPPPVNYMMNQQMPYFNPYGNSAPVYQENSWANHQPQTPPFWHHF